MNIYDFLDFLSLINASDVYISVYIDEYCGLDEWSVHIFEGIADEFYCTAYDLKNRYHIKDISYRSCGKIQIYLEEN